MPIKDANTIRKLIFYQYAKIIAKQAIGSDSKKNDFGFVVVKYHELIRGEIKWSDILRNDKRLFDESEACAYCGAVGDLQWEHIVPKSLRINERCATCDRIQSIHNMVRACKSCNAAKGDKGLYHFIHDSHPETKKFSDLVPVLVEEKYLKTIYCCHQCKGTLDNEIKGITVLDLDL